ncbi:hypothetical protein [Agrobacterium larrymoorei]|uniref:DUF3102 domain-containing protein n=1 Tax=Agrobacterium larrymoorei TaxID=160699 RepID=A0A4D7DXC7_9HYPH|nr:hypothetical protein [Agrobacterium larrymoorei]QCI98832.1 hypothetical protein CFBP5473_13565 [Agrobacterium larrymoorei]QYA08281.1 hypothetical protein J5285_06170 [Agrobacterium larrymoorei]
MSSVQTLKKANAGSFGRSIEKSDNPKKSEKERGKSLIERLDALHDAFKARRKAHRKAVYSDIVSAVEIGLALKADKNEWKLFCDGSWQKTKPPKPHQIEHAVRFAIKFMVGPGKKAQQKASFYYNAVASAVEEGITGKKLKKLMMTEGLKKLSTANSEKKKLEKQLAEDDKKEKKEATRTTAVTKESKKSNPLIANKSGDSSRQKEMKSAKFDVNAVLRFTNIKKSLMAHKVGSELWMKATLAALGPPLELHVHKVGTAKPKAKESAPDL